MRLFAALTTCLAIAAAAAGHGSPIEGTVSQGEVDVHPGGALCAAPPLTVVKARLTLLAPTAGDRVLLVMAEGATTTPGVALATSDQPSAETQEVVLAGCGDPHFVVVGMTVTGETPYEIVWGVA